MKRLGEVEREVSRGTYKSLLPGWAGRTNLQYQGGWEGSFHFSSSGLIQTERN